MLLTHLKGRNDALREKFRFFSNLKSKILKNQNRCFETIYLPLGKQTN